MSSMQRLPTNSGIHLFGSGVPSKEDDEYDEDKYNGDLYHLWLFNLGKMTLDGLKCPLEGSLLQFFSPCNLVAMAALSSKKTMSPQMLLDHQIILQPLLSPSLGWPSLYQNKGYNLCYADDTDNYINIILCIAVQQHRRYNDNDNNDNDSVSVSATLQATSNKPRVLGVYAYCGAVVVCIMVLIPWSTLYK